MDNSVGVQVREAIKHLLHEALDVWDGEVRPGTRVEESREVVLHEFKHEKYTRQFVGDLVTAHDDLLEADNVRVVHGAENLDLTNRSDWKL